MSTKTLRKRFALTAVVALVAGLVSVAPANASTGGYPDDSGYFSNESGNTGNPRYSGVNLDEGDYGQNLAVSAVVDTVFSVDFNFNDESDNWKLTNTGGRLLGSSQNDGYTFTPNNNDYDNNGDGSLASGGLYEDVDDEYEYVRATSDKAGTQTITFKPTDSGTTTKVSTLTITWLSEAGASISESNTVVYAVDGNNCSYSGNTATRSEMLAAAADEATTSFAKGNDIDVCIGAFDASGYGVEDWDFTAYSSLGGSASYDDVSDNALSVGNYDGYVTPATSGNGTITVVITKGSTTITKKIDITVYGAAKTLALANVTYAAAADGDTSDANTNGVFDSLDSGVADDYDIGTPGSADGALVLMAKDSAGALSDLLHDSAYDGITWTVDSDGVSGTPEAGSSDALGATVTFDSDTSEDGDLAATHLGGNGVLVRCGASAEKLTITAHGYDSSGNAIKSNSVNFYCSGSVATVTVTGAGSSVSAKAVDKNSYPVADGTEVTFAASNGAVAAPATKYTENGVATTLFIASSSAPSAAVTAIVGSKSGTSAAIAGTGTSSIASLVKKINALTKLIAKIQKKLGVK